MAKALRVVVNDYPLSFNEIAIWCKQFNIQDFAHVRRPQIVGAQDVCLVPYRVAHEVAEIVCMDIDFLLHLHFLSQPGF
ncbi:MAG: hypothetical protein E7070_06175 [Bacteroidales bacterium]|nr:hypothetical protein [Bacteroidales bacterium]